MYTQNMDDTRKMLRTIINGQSAFRQEVLGKLTKVETGLGEKIERLDKKIDRVEKNLTERIDKIGRQHAYLEDDAPTREEFDNLEKRVGKLEQKTTTAL